MANDRTRTDQQQTDPGGQGRANPNEEKSRGGGEEIRGIGEEDDEDVEDMDEEDEEDEEDEGTL